MSEQRERPKFNPNPERKEKFEDLGIEIGDRIYSKTGTYREVTDIIQHQNVAGGGYVSVERVDQEGNQQQQEFSFGKLLLAQEHIASIEKPPLPSNEADVSARDKARLNQISLQLQDPSLEEHDRKTLQQTKATILWDIYDKNELKRMQQAVKGITETMKREPIKDRVEQIQEFVRPENGDLLRKVIDRELFNRKEQGEKTQYEKIRENGFDLGLLRELGGKVRKKVLDFDESIQKGWAMAGVEVQGIENARPFVFSTDKDGTSIMQTSLMIGACVELSRLMRKMIAVTVEPDNIKASELLFKPEAEIDDKRVKAFIEQVIDKPEETVNRQKELLKIIDDPIKEKQYNFASRLLLNALTEKKS